MESNKNRKNKLRWFAILIIATVVCGAGGCVVSLNIQKNNSNATQSADQSLQQKQDSTFNNFNVNK